MLNHAKARFSEHTVRKYLVIQTLSFQGFLPRLSDLNAWPAGCLRAERYSSVGGTAITINHPIRL